MPDTIVSAPAPAGAIPPALPVTSTPLHPPRSPIAALSSLVPGLLLTSVIAGLGFVLREWIGLVALSPLILALVLGIAFHNLVGTPARARAGVAFSLRRILRFAIVLLGLQLTLQQVEAVGATGLAIIATTLVASLVMTKALGRLLGVDRKLAELIAAGTSICGASAVIATNTVTRAHNEDVAYAVACVTVFGSLAMLLYPGIATLIDLGPRAFGLWSGASIHEVAQVVAAAFQHGEEAGHFATIAKLSRVMMLAPVVIGLGLLATARARREGGTAGRATVPAPWFVFGFLAMIGINSLDVIPAGAKDGLVQVTPFLLAVALAAMGLETDVRKLRAKGLRPLLLAAASSLFIAVLSLALVLLTA